MMFRKRLFGKEQHNPLMHRFISLTINKRQRFVLSVLILSFSFFFSENLHLVNSGIFIALALGLLTNGFLVWSTYEDLRENFSPFLFILPFFYSVSFGLVYFILPDRLITRLILTTIYALGLYSIFLSQNIFIVGSMRTIALLSSARTVSFIVTILTYIFLVGTIFSFHFFVFQTVILLFLCTFFLTLYSMWTYSLINEISLYSQWAIALSLVLSELCFILWFWPTNIVLIALFFGAIFYTMVGLSHLWIERRLYRGVLWEYLIIALIAFVALTLYTFKS